MARTSSKNSALWAHADYMDLFNNNIEFEKFFKSISFRKFKKIVFVAESAKNSFLKIYPELEKKAIVIKQVEKMYFKKMITNSLEPEEERGRGR